MAKTIISVDIKKPPTEQPHAAAQSLASRHSSGGDGEARR